MAKNYDIAVLLDFYGELLTEKRRDFINYYYNDDLSLAEIAENEGLSRQGVRDTVKKAEEQLLEYERILKTAEKFRAVSDLCSRISAIADTIANYDSIECKKSAEQIKALTEELKNLG